MSLGTLSEADAAIAVVIAAARQLATAKGVEAELEDARSLVKSEAITRIMQMDDPQKGKPYSATAAEALVMTDHAYALHRSDQSKAAKDTIIAWGNYEAAKFRAQLATSLAGAGL